MYKSNGNTEGPDKVDMSLDDIIRLNKKQIQGQKAAMRKQRLGARGRLAAGRRAGAPLHRGGSVNKPVRRRGQGVITGLAARKAALLKGVGPLNRPVLNRTRNLPTRDISRAPAKQTAVFQRTQPFVSQRRRTPAHTQTQMPRRLNTQTGRVPNRPFRLRRKWNAPPVNEPQRDARQATFLYRRGLKVRAQVQKNVPIQAVQRTSRTRAWRTPLNSSGILTVSIDNPEARTQPEYVYTAVYQQHPKLLAVNHTRGPAHSWSLHPATVTPVAENALAESERKKPKGVALQFDINSVGKQQTAMTLNERFHILKMKRVAAAQQNTRGGRFVTVD